MPKFFNNKPRTSRPISRHRENPTITSHKESENERANEEIQQKGINKEIDDIKKGVVEIREYMRDEQMKKKMLDLLKELPRDDRIRNLIDQDREEINKNKSRSKTSIKK